MYNFASKTKRNLIDMGFLENVLVETPEVVAEETATEAVDEEINTPTDEVIAPIEEAVVEAPVIEKKKIDYNQFLQDNDDVFSQYYKEKNTDYTKMSVDKLAEIKIKRDNPTLSEEDVKAELEDKYGIGLQKLSENAEDYLEEEDYKFAKDHNKRLAKLQRELKKDAPLIANEFEEAKKSITLPEFELDFEASTEKLTDEQYIKKIQEEGEAYKSNVWIPELKKGLEAFESIKQQIEYEDNGSKVVLDVDYKLSDKDKAELIDELQDYVVTAKDQERYQDLDGFLKDKAPAKYMQKLMTTVAKEAAAKARANFVKNDLMNFDDSPRNSGSADTEIDFAKAVFANKTRNNL